MGQAAGVETFDARPHARQGRWASPQQARLAEARALGPDLNRLEPLTMSFDEETRDSAAAREAQVGLPARRAAVELLVRRHRQEAAARRHPEPLARHGMDVRLAGA